MRKQNFSTLCFDSGRKNIKKFMKFIKASIFTFPKLLSDLDISGNLDISAHGNDGIRIHDSEDTFIDVNFVFNKPGYISVTYRVYGSELYENKLYKIIRKNFFNIELEEIVYNVNY